VHPNERFTLTTEEIVGTQHRVSMSFQRLPHVVQPGDRLFLNDGLVQLIVEQVTGSEVHCTVAVGGELRSQKGLNLPGIKLGISAFTAHDRACLDFALKSGVDAVSQSFVETAADIVAGCARLRRAAPRSPLSSPKSSGEKRSGISMGSCRRRTAS
jgi:pyruvate kinase